MRGAIVADTAVGKGVRNHFAAMEAAESGDNSSTASDPVFWNDFRTETAGSWTTTAVGITLSKAICKDWFKDPADALDAADKSNFKKLMDLPNSRAAKAMNRLFKRFTPRLMEGSLKDSGVAAEKAGMLADEAMGLVNLADCLPEKSISNLPKSLAEQLSNLADLIASSAITQGMQAGLVELARVPASMNAALPVPQTTSAITSVEEMISQLA